MCRRILAVSAHAESYTWALLTCGSQGPKSRHCAGDFVAVFSINTVNKQYTYRGCSLFIRKDPPTHFEAWKVYKFLIRIVSQQNSVNQHSRVFCICQDVFCIWDGVFHIRIVFLVFSINFPYSKELPQHSLDKLHSKRQNECLVVRQDRILDLRSQNLYFQRGNQNVLRNSKKTKESQRIWNESKRVKRIWQLWNSLKTGQISKRLKNKVKVLSSLLSSEQQWSSLVKAGGV